ncbi:MAG: 16S rRNA (guanine(527)-N(7))-methyltransferase RsmG [Clostridia bacterium]|nr:16S rRNA (guanine(527)-N(7))-methyltransferase RsmG [Clostridia bacterium]
MLDIKKEFANFVDKDIDKVCELFEIYFHQLIDYNQKVNLTAITEKEEVYIKHFYDSCLASEFIPQNAKVLDVGTGAGFPGVPIKIVRNDIDLHLVDSLNKRIIFLNELKQKLNIKYSTYHSRAEDFCSQADNRESFDVCVSRAVAKLNILAEYCLPLVKVGGIFISYKAGEVEDELQQSLKAINILGGEVLNVKKLNLPNDMGNRTLIIIKKIKNTPKKYPRNKNLPKIKPL